MPPTSAGMFRPIGPNLFSFIVSPLPQSVKDNLTPP